MSLTTCEVVENGTVINYHSGVFRVGKKHQDSYIVEGIVNTNTSNFILGDGAPIVCEKMAHENISDSQGVQIMERGERLDGYVYRNNMYQKNIRYIGWNDTE